MARREVRIRRGRISPKRKARAKARKERKEKTKEKAKTKEKESQKAKHGLAGPDPTVGRTIHGPTLGKQSGKEQSVHEPIRHQAAELEEIHLLANQTVRYADGT